MNALTSGTLWNRDSVHLKRPLPEAPEREVTVLFADVRGFSNLAERTRPQLIGRLISQYMDVADAQIQAQGGRIVDCYGDGLLAMWSARLEPADNHAARACRCALAVCEQLPALSEQWQADMGEPLRIGIAINTGMALVGNTATQLHSKYGPFGHTVNLASRVQRAVKHFDLPILMTEATAKHLSDEFAIRRLARVCLRDLSQAVDLYELHGGDVDSAWHGWRRSYEQAFELFEAGRWAAVCQAVAPLLVEGHGKHDKACLQLLARAVERLQGGHPRMDSVRWQPF